MPDHSPAEIIRQASTLSILWGVLLIVFGMFAVGSPFMAAVAVSIAVAWLIILAGVVHLMLAFHVHRGGRLIWKLLVGLAYVFFGLQRRSVLMTASAQGRTSKASTKIQPSTN
jgi:uncharacterized membrane protein HdeD (DUF308 family)